MKEIWKDCTGKYKGWYQASNLGRVRSVDRVVIDSRGRKLNYKSKVLYQAKDNKGYSQVYLYQNSKQTTQKVHTLVALSFLGPKEGRTVDHIDGNKENNRLDNLEYVSRSENTKRAHHSKYYGLGYCPKKSIPKKINLIIAREIRFLVAEGWARSLLAEIYGIHVMTVGEIVRYEIWKEKN